MRATHSGSGSRGFSPPRLLILENRESTLYSSYKYMHVSLKRKYFTNGYGSFLLPLPREQTGGGYQQRNLE